MTEQIQTGFSQFLLYKVDREWRKIDRKVREDQSAEFAQVVQKHSEYNRIRSYLSVGFRHDIDFFLWVQTEEIWRIQNLCADLNQIALAAYLDITDSLLALYRRSPYTEHHDHVDFPLENADYLFVYPFVKTRAWYRLPVEERQRIMDDHIRVGGQFPTVRINTSYSFGLGDQEFVVAFETKSPRDFEALVRRLRETESSSFTLRDTPIYVGIQRSLRDTLKAL